MATQAEERRQKLRELNEQIRTEEARFNDDNLPSAEDVSRLEAMYNARADIRDDLSRLERVNMLREGNRAGADDVTPAVVRDNGGASRIVTLGQQFVDSQQFNDFMARAGGRMPASGKIPSFDGFRVGGFRELGLYADVVTGGSSTSAGAFIVNDRMAEFSPLGRRPLTLRDFIRILRTDSDMVEFVRQTSRTNNAAPVAEATGTGDGSGAKPESAVAYEVVQTPVKTIANWMPITRQAVSDRSQMRDLIDTELRDNNSEEFDEQGIAGDGSGQNFTGVLNTSNTQSQAWDTNVLTTTRKARTKVRTIGRAVPTAYGMHPTDWETIDLLQDNEARFIFGGPSVLGVPRLWGLPVFENEAFPVGTAVVADWRKAVAWDRQDSQIYVSDSHADFFTRNLLAILSELRAAFGVLQPSAFVEIDLSAS